MIETDVKPAVGTSVDERMSSLLASPQFSVATYLNLALRDAAAASKASPASAPNHHDDALQRRMAELALQLQLQTQSCHEDIGRIGAELQAILPRCAADVGRVGVGLEGMRTDSNALLETVVEETGEVVASDDLDVAEEKSSQQQQQQKHKQPQPQQQHFDVSSSLETLSTLHALQSNLSRTKNVLTAAATWDSNLNSIPPLLAQQNLTEAVAALSKLESGERALRGMPRPEDRTATIAKVRTQVQALLQPQLKHALQNMSTRLAPLQQCVALYTKLGTLDTLRDEYVKTRPQAIHKAWFSYAPSYSTDDNNNDDGGTGQAAQSDAFVTWLPGWYDAVLSLLSEERRQSSSVFGAELAPQMLVRVLKECFRPILPSFRSRLDKVFSRSSQSQPSGSFESICAAYESTLRMLSMAYETVAGAYIDVVESGTAASSENTNMDGVDLYQELMAVVLHVASPFEEYQKSFGQLEVKYTRTSSQHVSKEIQQAVSSVSPNSLDQLQEAIEKLKDLAPFIFPMAESSFDRFELLNGGYMATQALKTVDQLLSGHIGELIIAIRTLSAALTSNVDQLAEQFDEQHVLCSMEILKLAGSFRQDIQTFETKTLERFSILLERMVSHLATAEEIDGVASGSAAKRSSFVLPDSLSVVEIDSVLTRAVCNEEGDSSSTSSLAVLERLSSRDNEMALYPESRDEFSQLVTSCHTFVSDVCSAVPRKYLSSMSTMEVWVEANAESNFDSYGTLPQSYITHVGEHMLALVQALEPFSSDPSSLALANQAMDNVTDIALPIWKEFVTASGLVGSGPAALLMDGKNIGDLVLSNAALDEEELDEETTEQDKASAAFCNIWLDAIGLAVTGRILERIMRIKRLSAKGCEHLSADLNYLINVFSALGVAGHPHPLLSHLAELAVLDPSALKEHIRRRDVSPAEEALYAIEVQLAVLRGIDVK